LTAGIQCKFLFFISFSASAWLTESAMKYVTRFAPSPTGYLHAGHAYSASLAFQKAQESGGRFILRLEDIDQTRCRREFEEGIYEDLTWIGLSWEQPVRRQSEHMDDYAAVLEKLHDDGLIYPCFCTRREIAAEIARSDSAPHGPGGPLYPGTCRHLSDDARADNFEQNKPYALRFDMQEALTRVDVSKLFFQEIEKGMIQCDPLPFGDAILARKDTPTSYHLSVVLDDALQGINLVVRGQDLFMATHLHRLLQHLLSLPTPHYMHHGLVSDMKGQRLAKRHNASTLRHMREEGYGQNDIQKLIKFKK
jgi:glutamyl-Q tRNA(Asp) synthetase